MDLFELVLLYFLDVDLEVDPLDSVVSLLSFLINSTVISAVTAQIYIPTSNAGEVSLFPRSSPALIIRRLSDILR